MSEERKSPRSLTDREAENVCRAYDKALKERYRGSQTRMADAIGISQQTISEYVAKTPKKPPGWAAARKLAAALRVNLDDLISGAWESGTARPALLCETAGWSELRKSTLEKNPRLTPDDLDLAGKQIMGETILTESELASIALTLANARERKAEPSNESPIGTKVVAEHADAGRPRLKRLETRKQGPNRAKE